MWNKEHLDVFKICERERWQESYKRVFYLRSGFPATVKTSAPSRQQQTSCVLKCIFSAKLTGDTATICKLTKRNGVQRLYLKFYVQSESPGDLTAEKQTFPPQRRSNAHTKIIHATPSFFFFWSHRKPSEGDRLYSKCCIRKSKWHSEQEHQSAWCCVKITSSLTYFMMQNDGCELHVFFNKEIHFVCYCM